MNSDDSSFQRLIALEAEARYNEPPPAEGDPFLVVERKSAVVISAPHGCRAFRNSEHETWHEEDEFTSGIARILGEMCEVAVIASVWRDDNCDPNAHAEDRCRYKQRLRALVAASGARWVLDLHGASESSPRLGKGVVDLGTRKHWHSLDVKHRDMLRDLITARFGAESVSIDGFPAVGEGTVTAFCQQHIGIQAVQIEMKPSVRVARRRADASSFQNLGPYSAPAGNVVKMLGALSEFVRYLIVARPNETP